ncbi:DNA double-strand break repair nuclease NurA [Melghirimyces algeriensis]|uniref:NurA domain-containing protein n=1 Tax=Melghirimyces algeriensis TaxID=910412 RepID=A0A521EC00_9BACL|nr:DNA double-strand break repair nuclease NurA [Melghirimyces algeriensis]SMO81447.1 NurA domain-containing protein [Melghirimyces algeriensis]
MLPVSEELKQKLEEANRDLRNAYSNEVFHTSSIRKRLESIGSILPLQKWKGEEMKEWLNGRCLVGVDGSVNSTPGADPHILSIFQALAKSTQGEEHWAADLYTPLLDREMDSEDGVLAREAKNRGRILAGLEIQVALEAVRRWKPRVVLMDGSLLHFRIDQAQAWERLVQEAEQSNVLLAGVSEEIGTKGLARSLFPERDHYSDRDILFGTMKPGEVYFSSQMDPVGTGLWKAVLCPSRNPQPVGVDGLESQSEAKEELIRLIYSLTPVQGRGIPLWLDIVDREVRVTDSMVAALVEQHIDPDLRHRLLVPKRSDRVL